MATTNLMAGLFKTPEQVKAEQEQALMEQGSRSAGMLLKQPTRSGIAAGILGQGAAAAQYMPKAADRFVKGMLGAAGGVAGLAGNQQAQAALQQAAVSPEVQRAQQMQEKLAKAKGDYAGLMALGQEMLRSGDMQGAYAVLAMAKDLKPEAEEADINTMDTNDMKNIAAIGANQFQCDVRKDPQCFLKAKEEYINLKRADTAQQKMEVFGYEGLSQRREEAEAAARSIRTANQSLRLLDSGEVNVGLLPKTKQGAYKLASELFGWQEGKEVVTRTAALLSSTKLLAGELLASKMFGSGTAISERDLLTAQEIAGAAETLTPESMKQILELNAKMNQTKIEGYNKKLNRYSPEFYARTPEGVQEGFIVEAPELYKTKNIGKEEQKDAKKVPVFEDDKMFMVPVGAQVGTYKGTRGYTLDGKFYNFEGQEVK
jgi:hypothetical protein